jgi:hypothetical protein
MPQRKIKPCRPVALAYSGGMCGSIGCLNRKAWLWAEGLSYKDTKKSGSCVGRQALSGALEKKKEKPQINFTGNSLYEN